MMAEWSPAEDLRPAFPLFKRQPEQTARGAVWTQVVCFNWPAPGWTHMTIREVAGDYLLGHGRVYQIPKDEDDAA